MDAAFPPRSARYASAYGMSPWRLFFDTCFRPALPVPLKAIYRRMASPFRPAPGPSLVREDALEWTGARERMARVAEIPDFSDPVQGETYAAIFTGWGPTVLTENYELMVSYFGIEMRQPFRDRRLVEFALALPANQLWRDGWSRFAFRKAMTNIVPERILKRRGKGMFLQLYDSVLAGSQAHEVQALVEDSVLARLGIVDANVLRNQVKQYQSSPHMTSTVPVSDVVALEILCREILEEPGPIRQTGEGISAKNAAQSTTP